jgi:hypothetical protein
MWHTDIVESFKISEIKIQYMDGTMKTIPNWKAVLFSKETKNAYETIKKIDAELGRLESGEYE